MRTYLHRLFHVAEQEKIDEKTMLARIAVSVCIVLFCLTANVVSAYAYFSCTITSGSNTIVAGQFSIKTTAPAEAASLMTEQEGYLLYNDTEESKGYAFEISKAQDATASVGYAKIEIVTDINDLEDEDETNDVQKFFTLPIGTYLDPVTGEEVEMDSRTIEIVVPAGQTAYVTFVAEWGSCSQEPIVDNGIIEPEFTGAILIEEETDPEDSEDIGSDDTETSAEDTGSEEAKTETPAEDTGSEDVKTETPTEGTGSEEAKTETPAEDTGSEEAKTETPTEDTGSEEAKTETPTEGTGLEEAKTETPAEDTGSDAVRSDSLEQNTDSDEINASSDGTDVDSQQEDAGTDTEGEGT